MTASSTPVLGSTYRPVTGTCPRCWSCCAAARRRPRRAVPDQPVAVPVHGHAEQRGRARDGLGAVAGGVDLHGAGPVRAAPRQVVAAAVHRGAERRRRAGHRHQAARAVRVEARRPPSTWRRSRSTRRPPSPRPRRTRSPGTRSSRGRRRLRRWSGRPGAVRSSPRVDSRTLPFQSLAAQNDALAQETAFRDGPRVDGRCAPARAVPAQRVAVAVHRDAEEAEGHDTDVSPAPLASTAARGRPRPAVPGHDPAAGVDGGAEGPRRAGHPRDLHPGSARVGGDRRRPSGAVQRRRVLPDSSTAVQNDGVGQETRRMLPRPGRRRPSPPTARRAPVRCPAPSW